MSKAIFSAMMFALLCTGTLSLDNANQNSHLQDFSRQSIIHQQIMHQQGLAIDQNQADDDDDQKKGASHD